MPRPHLICITTLRRLVREERAATGLEYGLIALIVSVGIILSLYAYQQASQSLFTYVDSTVNGALAGGS